jgi:hypothetical protein
VAEFSEVIPPGQEGHITLEVLGEKVSGTWRKSATVTTDDPTHERLTISLGGKVINHVDIKPSRVYLRGMYGEQVGSELQISSNEKKKDLEILDVTSNIDDKMTYKVIPGGEPGPDKVVQINVVTRGSIIVQPSTLNFGNVRSSNPNGVEKTITVSKVVGDFQIRDVAFSSAFYEATIEPVEEGKKYKVKINFRPESDQKSYVDEMIINTDDPQEPSIRVRLIARGVL